MWSDFNTANRTAMMRSELFSWPVTLAILVLAFGSLVAAGLPLMLTITGLVASAGVLALGTQVADVSIWAMNFALMFALALGIDYALFIVARYRAALFGSDLSPVEATAVTMDTAGKAVLFSGRDRADLADGGDARPQPRIPLDGARHHGLGGVRAGGRADAAARRVVAGWDRASTGCRCAGCTPASTAPRASPPGPSASGAIRWRSAARRWPSCCCWPRRSWALRTGMPSIKVVPTSDTSRVGYTQVAAAFGPGAPGALQVVAPGSRPCRCGSRPHRRPGDRRGDAGPARPHRRRSR